MNYQEFMNHWHNEMDCEYMATGVSHVLKKAKESAKNLRRAGQFTVAERDEAIKQLTDYCDRRKAEVKRAA